MTVTFVLRSNYDKPSGKLLRRFDDATLLDWFRNRWDKVPDEITEYLYTLLGHEVDPFGDLFREIQDTGLPVPENFEHLERHVRATMAGEIRMTEHQLTVMFADDVNMELCAYLFDDAYRDGGESPIDDSAPIRCKLGEVVGCVLVFRDISERKAAERALHEKTATLRAISDTTSDLIFVKDRECRLIFANPATLAVIGMTEAEALHRDPPELFHDSGETAHDGVEALTAAEEFRPAVVLMDIGMPRLNGLDACRRLREQPWGRAMVLIALTGWGQEEDKRQTREAGFDHHLIKPVDPVVLQRLLDSLGQSG